MAQTSRKSIGFTLGAVMGVLALLHVCSTLPRIWTAWLDFDFSKRVERLNSASNLLFDAADGYGFERGRTDAALRSPGPAEAMESDRRFIAEGRRKADEALASALAVLAALEQHGTGPLVAALDDDRERQADLRLQVDAALAMPFESRPKTLPDKHFAAMSGLVEDLTRLLHHLAKDLGEVDGRLGTLLSVKLEALAMRDVGDPEPSLLLAAFGDGSRLGPALERRLDDLRVLADAHWRRLRLLCSDASDPTLLKALGRVEKEYFSARSETYDGLRAALRAGAAPAVSREEFAALAVKSRAPLAGVIRTVGALADARAGELRASAFRTLTLLSLGLLGNLAVILAAVRFVRRRLTRPLDDLTAYANALAAGRCEEDPPYQSRTDEIGELARGLRVFGENLVRRREAEEARAKAHAQLRAAFEAIPGLVIVIDPDFNVLDASDKLLAARGLNCRDEIVGHKCHCAFKGLDAVCEECLLPEQKLTGGLMSRFSSPAEERLTGMAFKAYSAPVLDESGQVFAYVECLMDISDLRRVERELTAAKEAAEAASRAKSDFLANMSHELRTPLNGMLGMLQILELTSLTSEQREYADMAARSGKALLAIINDILDFSKIEAGKMEIVEEEFSLGDAIRDSVRLFEPQARSKELDLTCRVGPGIPGRLRGDSVRVRQIVLNLVGNAVKFTHKGGVSVEADATEPPDESERVDVLLTVTDTGVGIQQDKLAAVFEPFIQADSSIAKRYQGTGLGLGIVKRLAEMMGGEVSLESAEGEGTTVRVSISLPLARPFPILLPDAEDEADETPVRRGAVLLAEDNSINQLAIRRYLQGRGYSVEPVASGEEAVASAERKSFDCVLMDIQMPGMDGMEAAARIRASGRSRQTPIIALTGYAMKGDKERFLAAGMDDYLSKPIDFAELERLMERAMAKPRPQSPEAG